MQIIQVCLKNNDQTVCLCSADLGSSLSVKSSACVTFPGKIGLPTAFSFSLFVCSANLLTTPEE